MASGIFVSGVVWCYPVAQDGLHQPQKINVPDAPLYGSNIQPSAIRRCLSSVPTRINEALQNQRRRYLVHYFAVLLSLLTRLIQDLVCRVSRQALIP